MVLKSRRGVQAYYKVKNCKTIIPRERILPRHSITIFSHCHDLLNPLKEMNYSSETGPTVFHGLKRRTEPKEKSFASGKINPCPGW